MRQRFIFFGTPRFAESALGRLIENGIVPSLVVCNPDRPTGRKKEITPPPAKILAQKHDIPVFQPEKIAAESLKTEIDKAEFGVLASYGKIIPKETIELFPKGIIGIHPSLLPEYRGATPIQSAILSGEKETGVSVFLMDEKVDHGPVIGMLRMPIAHDDTYLVLEKKLALAGADLLAEILPGYLEGKIAPKEQEHEKATFTKKTAADDAFLPLEDLSSALQGDMEKARRIDRMVRALNPEPGVWTTKDGKRMKILGTRLLGSGLMLTKIQMEGKAPREIDF